MDWSPLAAPERARCLAGHLLQFPAQHLLTVSNLFGLSYGPTPCAFATRQEAKSSCPAPRNTGSGIFGHTSRRRTHQNLHAGYLHHNLGKIGRAVRRSRPTEFRRARRGTTLSTGLQAPQSCAARVSDASRYHDRCAAVSGRDQLGRQCFGRRKAGNERPSRPPTIRRHHCTNCASRICAVLDAKILAAILLAPSRVKPTG